ncbi:hypothetical protein [Streptomyces ipomoeae]|uniref:hypothetical protein n=1 Tax=Streptomyces ipomoeae TaxID=103232 RepID=UPI0029B20010|nr:hypothetical protein [Streptomyces ipomoeae]MDX2699881.1 hypothetical protein [Streptomyces ipomoeae]
MTDTVHTPKPLDRAAKAEALLLRFTAEAHRRKWDYDRGLDGDGVPIKSEAFDALHRLGEEMRVELEKLRALPAASVAVVPAADRAAPAEPVCRFEEGCHRVAACAPGCGTPWIAADRAALRDRIRRAVCEAEGFAWDSDMLEPDEYGEVADAVLSVLPAPADRAAVLREAEEALRQRGKRLAGEFNDSDILHEDGPAATVATWKRAADVLHHMAAAPGPVVPAQPGGEA